MASEETSIVPGTFVNHYLPKTGTNWPDKVFVLTEDDNFSGPIYSDTKSGEPVTINAWVDNEFRGMFYAKTKHITTSLMVWWSIHEHLITFLKHKHLYTKTPAHTIFNTVWAVLGYIEEQDDDAIAIALSFRSYNNLKEYIPYEKTEEHKVKRKRPNTRNNKASKR